MGKNKKNKSATTTTTIDNNKKKKNINNNKKKENEKRREVEQPPSSKRQKMNNKKTEQPQQHNNQAREDVVNMLSALMDADIPMPTPVVLLNSLTTHSGRKTLIQHIIHSCQQLSVAFVLSESIAKTLLQSVTKSALKSCKIFHVGSSEQRLNAIIEIGSGAPDCPYDCIVTDVNTVNDFQILFDFFEQESEKEQNDREYVAPLFLDTVVSIANLPFLAKHFANVKDIRTEQPMLAFSLDVTNVILLNFRDAVDDKTVDSVASKLCVVNQVEHSFIHETSFAQVDLFHILGTRLVDPELYDRFEASSKNLDKSELLSIQNDLPIPAAKKMDKVAPKTSPEPVIAKHKNVQVFTSLAQVKDIKKKHLTVVTRNNNEALARVEHFLENMVLEYKSFPAIEVEKIAVADVGPFVEEHLRQVLLMKYYGEYEDDDEQSEDEPSKKKKHAQDDDDDEEDEDEDGGAENEDEESMQKMNMDPEFFLKLHADDLDTWITDIAQCATVFAKQLNNKKAVKLSIRQSSDESFVTSHYEERILFVSYLGNGVRWYRAEEPNAEVIVPKYAVGIRTKGSHIQFENKATAPHGFRIVMTIQ